MKKTVMGVRVLVLAGLLLCACKTEKTKETLTQTPTITETATSAPESLSTTAMPTEGPTATPTVLLTLTPTPTPAPTSTPVPTEIPVERFEPIVSDGSNLALEAKWKEKFDSLTLQETLKEIGYDAPAMTQRLGADPCAMIYDGRVYIYLTGEVVEYGAGGKPVKNTYGKINTINVISSEDLVNWTDHGSIYAAGYKGAAKWCQNSWAPTAAYKEIDGKTKFFVYFADSGRGIGVLTADSPTGPFTDPLGKALIDRSTPNCWNVTWLFDPAVLVDDDGSAYIYFGGGVPAGKAANPGTGRVAKLGEDMISLACDPVTIEIPYLFEDSGINKIGDTYYYSYCTNWQVDKEGTAQYGFSNAQIAYMTSDNPMGPFTYQGIVFKNQNDYFSGNGGNNHHSIFEFYGNYYITYHTRVLGNKMGLSGLDYRSAHVTQIQLKEDGTFDLLKKTNFSSLKQVKPLNPYERVEAETMATMAGINTVPEGEEAVRGGSGNMALSDIHSGDWVALYGVDFGEKGAEKFSATVKSENLDGGAIRICLDKPEGEVIGYLEIEGNTEGEYRAYTADLLKRVTGEHTLVFVFYGEDYLIDHWKFQ